MSINRQVLDEWKTAAFKLVSEFQDEEFSKAETDMANRILFLIDVVRNQREVIGIKDKILRYFARKKKLPDVEDLAIMRDLAYEALAAKPRKLK